MDSGNKQGSSSGGRGRYLPTGVSNEAYDIITSLHHKLNELWHIDEFLSDANDAHDKTVWQAVRDHDRADIDSLVAALKKSLGSTGS